jgi:hypothetical protein
MKSVDLMLVSSISLQVANLFHHRMPSNCCVTCLTRASLVLLLSPPLSCQSQSPPPFFLLVRATVRYRSWTLLRMRNHHHSRHLCFRHRGAPLPLQPFSVFSGFISLPSNTKSFSNVVFAIPTPLDLHRKSIFVRTISLTRQPRFPRILQLSIPQTGFSWHNIHKHACHIIPIHARGRLCTNWWEWCLFS